MATIPQLPDGFVAQRLALHRLAGFVIAPVRHRAVGRFGLRWTPGGFGTPPFPDVEGERQIRVEGQELVDEHGGVRRRAPITSLEAAAAFLGSTVDGELTREEDGPDVGDVTADLGVSYEAVAFLDAWYGMAFRALGALRDDEASVDASEPQLWPGHFDPAIEVGDADHRGSYGASPGDEGHPESYLYVSVWQPDAAGLDRSDTTTWNATTFPGAVLPLRELAHHDDPVTVALTFWRVIRDALTP